MRFLQNSYIYMPSHVMSIEPSNNPSDVITHKINEIEEEKKESNKRIF